MEGIHVSDDVTGMEILDGSVVADMRPPRPNWTRR